ncbi:MULTISPECIES: single-stranded DNA-binding protein [Nocardioides]|uniref:single-stranded DNA-binding protein n=1 Tax=Nocardioides TaxID=1839 RepID=UPI0005663936|nr:MULTISPECIES: single-stranded DNA-binding protein [Nocardioides]
MSAQTAVELVNSVRLVGRISGVAEEKTLPSGSVIVAFRVVIDRPPGHESGQRVDTLECTAWTARVRRSVRTWRQGDLVEVDGAVRRRFYATPVGKASRVEIEVSGGRMVRRAPSA